jgi:tetratricopeptide (TPR) repeat protein
MKKIIFLTNILLIYFLFSQNSFASKINYFFEGENLFKEKEYEKSKLFFEKDLAFNPKNTKSYLYLAKIFNIKDNDEEENINLNNALLIEPDNDEAIYMLTLLKIKQSDYNSANDLINKFILVCKSLCEKSEEMKNKLDKISP